MGGIFSTRSSSSSQSQPQPQPHLQSQPQPQAQQHQDDGNSSVLVFHSKDSWNSKWQTLKTGNKLVVIDFSASWCPPCHFMEPIFKEYAEMFTDVIFVKIDVDELKNVAEEWRVEAMPTFVFVKEGKEVDRLLGADKDGLKERIMKFRV